MNTSDEIIVRKYDKELGLLKKIFFRDSIDEVSDFKFFELVRFVMLNPEGKEDAKVISKKLDITEAVLFKMYDFFFSHNGIGMLGFDFSEEISNKNFIEESQVVDFVENILKSSMFNRKIVEDLELTDLISKKAFKDLEQFIIEHLFNKKFRAQFNKFFQEINSGGYKLAKVKLKENSEAFIDITDRMFKNFLEFKVYYIKIIYPFVSVHDKDTLSEVATVKLSHLEVEYV